MPGLIISSGVSTTGEPTSVGNYIISAAREWPEFGDTWEDKPSWILESAEEHLGNQGMGRMVFHVPHGMVIPHTAAPNAVPQFTLPLNIVGWWVRLYILTNNQRELVWQGRVMNESASKGGTDVRNDNDQKIETGNQTFVAYSGLHILQRIMVNRSWWLIDGGKKSMQRLHTMNIRDSRGLIVGNASAMPYDDGNLSLDPIYLHSGEGNKWNRRRYLQYIMRHYLQRQDRPEPQWTLGGDALQFLADFDDSLDFGSAPTLDSIIRRIIDPKFGIDYAILPTNEGYELNVFALSGEDVTFGTHIAPRNTNLAEVRVDDDIGLESNTIVRSFDHRYRRIKVVGKPIISCFSLWASNTAGTTSTLPPQEQRESLVKKWTDALETAYKEGKSGSTDPAKHDLARGSDRFVNVYQLFGAPLNWDFHSKQILPDVDAEEGKVIALIGHRFAGDGQQQAVRRTLAFLPLKEGFDYKVDPPTDANLADTVPDFMRPVAYIWNDDDTIGATGYMKCEDAGIGVHLPQNDWGVFLQANPNHRLADDHWTGAEDTLVDPVFDWNTLIVTIAIELDWRLTLIFDDDTADDDGSELIIEVDDAEFWYLAPETVVRIDEDGRPVLSPSKNSTAPGTPSGTTGQQFKEGVVLRDDSIRIVHAMAGAIARYQNERARCSLRFRGLRPFTRLLGTIMQSVVNGGTVTPVGSIISTVRITATDSGEAFTEVMSGHAAAD